MTMPRDRTIGSAAAAFKDEKCNAVGPGLKGGMALLMRHGQTAETAWMVTCAGLLLLKLLGVLTVGWGWVVAPMLAPGFVFVALMALAGVRSAIAGGLHRGARHF